MVLIVTASVIIFFLGIMIYISIKDTISLNKQLEKSKKISNMYALGMEEYYFLISDEYEIAEIKVSSLCNELGIVLQSDIENDNDEYYW